MVSVPLSIYLSSPWGRATALVYGVVYLYSLSLPLLSLGSGYSSSLWCSVGISLQPTKETVIKTRPGPEKRENFTLLQKLKKNIATQMCTFFFCLKLLSTAYKDKLL